MRPSGLLHPELLTLAARAGHGDIIVLADAGLKIPLGSWRIDLGLTKGVPSMIEVLDALLPEVVVESAIIADEMSSWNPELHAGVVARVPVESRRPAHEQFAKELATRALAYVKTAECTAYASVALVCGVSYFDEAVAHFEEVQRTRGNVAIRQQHTAGEERRR